MQTEHKSPKMSLKQNVNTHKSRVAKTSAELLSSVPGWVCFGFCGGFFVIVLLVLFFFLSWGFGFVGFFGTLKRSSKLLGKSLSEHARKIFVFSSNDKQFGTTLILKSSRDTETSHSFPSKEGWRLQSAR